MLNYVVTIMFVWQEKLPVFVSFSLIIEIFGFVSLQRCIPIQSYFVCL